MVVMIGCDWLIHDLHDYRDKITKTKLPVFIRAASIAGTYLVFRGVIGDPAETLGIGLALVIWCEIRFLRYHLTV